LLFTPNCGFRRRMNFKPDKAIDAIARRKPGSLYSCAARRAL
jgi:hypothetical protein